MRQRPKPPISSFGNEILSALLAGSLKEVRIALTYREAVSMRQRLYQLRQRMREEDHEAALAVARCFITIEWSKGTKVMRNSKNVEFPSDRSTPSTLILRPQDSQFAKALNQAGVVSNELTDAIAVEEGDVLRDYLIPTEPK